ncbi:UDP-glucose 4-epimerase [Tahibacter aquaticus]|uniref:UDP-glucose 4-epimerase n=1 Tax=Tahibacter aquaticus TaxID=520092 RepID=A0A4R6Z0L9_9GAMM|nr:NAD(P)-dependent oxidoreductase [Tahibacter aquaticus]TDR45077.1 UDP-glucose 4-epimerase [Tahibacter aquaticus]
MNVLVTGSAGHLGEALMRSLRARGLEARGIDLRASEFTDKVGSIVDAGFVDRCMHGCDAVIHAATLHKPHVATHARQEFVDVNISGTLNVLEACVAHRVKALVFTSTTSTFGAALVPPPGEPAAWISEDVRPVPKNIYGVTKIAAEDLCELFQRKQHLPCLVLRTSRFFPEEDDSADTRASYADANSKVNELLYRRVDIQDVVDAHLLALDKAPSLGFDKFIVSATPPFQPADMARLRSDAPGVVEQYCPSYVAEYRRRGWRMLPSLDRVYSNAKARKLLGWQPRYDFAHALEQLRQEQDYRSPLTHAVGAKGYHAETFEHGPYPV